LLIIINRIPRNERQIEHGVRMVIEKNHRKVGILGISFKAGTDDLRESPLVELVERLLGKGYELRIYDRNVSLASLVGANRDYILNRIPHISKLMVESMDEVLAFGETLVIGNGSEEFRSVPERLRPGQVVVDLVRVSQRRSDVPTYDGICW
jgi:GDP-mannose 6-dehydrogenase